MAIIIDTTEGAEIIQRINAAIRQKKGRGAAEGWALDEEEDYTYKPEQWSGRAWFRSDSAEGEPVLVFNLLGETITQDLYGRYHGRFVELLICHASDLIDGIVVTPVPDYEEGDECEIQEPTRLIQVRIDGLDRDG